MVDSLDEGGVTSGSTGGQIVVRVTCRILRVPSVGGSSSSGDRSSSSLVRDVSCGESGIISVLASKG